MHTSLHTHCTSPFISSFYFNCQYIKQKHSKTLSVSEEEDLSTLGY